MKKSLLIILTLTLFVVSGCQQLFSDANNAKTEAEKLYKETAEDVENAKNKVIETKAEIDEKIDAVEEKIDQIEDAADAIKKVTE